MRRLVIALAFLTIAAPAYAQCGSGLGLFSSFRARREARAMSAGACYGGQSYGAVSYSVAAGQCATGQCPTGVSYSFAPTVSYAPATFSANCPTGTCPPAFARPVVSYSVPAVELAPIVSTVAPSPQAPTKVLPPVPQKATPQATKCAGGCFCPTSDVCTCDSCPLGHKKNAIGPVPVPPAPPTPPTTFIEPIAIPATHIQTVEWTDARGRVWRQSCRYNAAGVRLACLKPIQMR